MNIHILVEGVVGERQVYQYWVPLVNPSLSCVQHVSEIQADHFAIVAGGGYPHYFGIIDVAIEDVNTHGNIDRLVIAVDSEEMEFDEKYREIEAHLEQSYCVAEIRVVVQHFCLETWALGNRIIIRPNPQDAKLREYRRFYNVRNDDPELLPGYQPEELNRAQFAEKYLRRALQDKYRGLTYTKSNPNALLHVKYFQRVKERLEQTGHIRSFEAFLTAFI